MKVLNKQFAFTLCGLVAALGAVYPQAAVAKESKPPAVQAGNASQESNADAKQEQNSIEALRKFEPSADEEYTLGAGDAISIDYPGHADLSSKDVIGPDGRITLPLVGPMKIAGLTREEAGGKIVDALSPFYTKLTATVRVEKYSSNYVTLLGDVKSPGMVSFDQTPTLLGLLSRGGMEPRTDGTFPEQCVIYRGDQVYWVKLHDMLAANSPMTDLRLRRNDVVFVPALATKSVTVLGRVQHPGLIVLKRDSTVVTVLGEAGGLSDGAGKNPEILVVHRISGDKNQFVHFKDLLKPESGNDVPLYPGDIVFVPQSGWNKASVVIQNVTPFLTMATFAAIAIQ
jgi:polysaccharide export outer membrane protein